MKTPMNNSDSGMPLGRLDLKAAEHANSDSQPKSGGSPETALNKKASSRSRSQSRLAASERQFLPSALEVLETPPNPLSRCLALAIGTLVVGAVFWAIIGKVDIVAVTQGQVSPIGGVKVIQSFETGTVRRILVADGQRVAEGDVLVNLDPTESQSDKGQLLEELAEAAADLQRLRILLDRVDGQPGGDIEPSPFFDEDRLEISRYRLNSDALGYETQVLTMKANLERNKSEEMAVKAELEKQIALLPLLEDQEAGLKRLYDEGLTPKERYLEIKTRLIETSQNIKVEQHRLAEVRSGGAVQRKELEKYTADQRSELVRQYVEAQKAFKQTELALKAVELRENLNSLKAPVSGTVQQMAVHTVGGVVTPAEPLMVVVPDNAELEVRSKLLNKDKGFVRPGMEVEIKLDAFPFTKYGTLSGKVISISQDAVQDEALGLIFDTRISLDQKTLLVDGEEVFLSPGMSAQAEVKTGKRRIIEFILAPILRYKDEALRER